MKSLIVIALSLSITFACQGYCNGHGECDTGDKCNCYPGWGGAECNLRSCPYSDAFVDLLPGDLDHDGSVTTTSNHAVLNEWSPVVGIDEAVGIVITDSKRAHRYAECSNAGICDRSSGLCNCNSGFEGSACQRRSCPASSDGLVCSGHGMCLSSEASIVKNGNSFPSGWEYQKFGVCECDKGWTGISCGSRVCAKGLDPVKVGRAEYKFSTTSDVVVSSSDTKNHYYEMVYDGVKYTTPIIPARTDVCNSSSSISEAAEDIRRALVSILPLSQSKVSIKCNKSEISSIDITTPYIELDLNITYNSTSPCQINIGSDTVNKPNSFTVYDAGTSKSALFTLKITTSASKITVDQNSFISCSGRGICDGTTGLCQCFDNYSGLACERTRN